MAELDRFGINRQEATETLDQFLHQGLHERNAKLTGVQLVDGQWQSQVENSQQGIRVVFLTERHGQVVPAHATGEETPFKES